MCTGVVAYNMLLPLQEIGKIFFTLYMGLIEKGNRMLIRLLYLIYRNLSSIVGTIKLFAAD